MITKTILTSAFIALTGLTLLGLGARSQQPVPDEQIQTLVEHKLREAGILEGNVSASVKNGDVFLSGMVPHVWAKQKAIELALEAPGVQAVESELTIASAESDEDLAESISDRILRYAFFTVFDDVNLSVKNGVVTLTGRVTMPYKADQIGEMVARILGVQELVNEIETLPVSQGDTRLRAAISRAIYGDPMFYEYAFRTNPPIHIIVENGRVTLTGVVRSEVERRRAASIARSTFGVFSVENKLELSSAR